MSTVITELPITEADINVVEENKSVELSAEKFKDLLDYLTHVEDELSIAKFDLDSERKYAGILLYTLAKLTRSINAEYPDTEIQRLVLDWIRYCRKHLDLELKEGAISGDHVRQFSLLFRRLNLDEATNAKYRVR
jgi:hypothetical protein